jgi:hypothetical protein
MRLAIQVFLVVMLTLPLGCTIPGQYPDGSVVYLDDSGKPVRICWSRDIGKQYAFIDWHCEEIK